MSGNSQDVVKRDGGQSQKSTSDGGSEAEHFRKLFIGGLSPNTTDESLHSFYSQYGQLVDHIVMRDSATKRSKCFGFVTFSTKSELDNSMSNRPHTIDGKVVDPKRAVPRDQNQKSEQNVSTTRLYVSGVREEHNEETMERYFGEYGKVTKVEMFSDKNTQKNRGFAFVTFDDHDPVDRCVLLRSHMIGGHRCDVKKALSREEMQKAQQKERDHMERGMRSRGGRGGDNYGRNGGGGGYPSAAGGYGGYGGGGGGGYGPPQSAWGPPQWGGGYGQYGGAAYAQPTAWSAQQVGAGTGPPQATDQGQWASGGGYAAVGGTWGGTAAAAGVPTNTASGTYPYGGTWPSGPPAAAPAPPSWGGGGGQY